MNTYNRGGVVAVALAVLMRCAVAVTEHRVGSGTCDADPSWSLDSTCDFNAWSQTQDFVVGDTIVFTFTIGSSNVAEVNEEDYLTCKTGVTPATAYSVYALDSPLTLLIEKAGPIYFIAEMDSACSNPNLKMVVNAKSAAGDAVAPSTSSSTAADANPTTVVATPAASPPPSHHKSSIVAPVAGGTVGFVFLVAKLALMLHCHKKKLALKKKDRLEAAELTVETSTPVTPVVNVHIHTESLKGTADDSAEDPPSSEGSPDKSAKAAASNV